MSPRQVVLASSNPGKLKEMKILLAGIDYEVLAQAQFSVSDVEETGLSFVENAILKARHAAQHAGLPAIADDSGIQVDVLGGAPGIYSARYAGLNASDEENLNLMLENVRATGARQAAARFQCVMAYVGHAGDAMPLIAQGTWHGSIVMEPRGENGFGYDPVFFVPTHQCTSAELPFEEKNRISHRGLAMQKLLHKLTDEIS